MTTVNLQARRLLSLNPNALRSIALLWVAIAAACVLLVYLGNSTYNRAKKNLADQAHSFAHLIAAHDRFGFTLADALLKGMIDHLTWDDFNGEMTPERRATVLARLVQYRERLPGIASFTVIGADGIRRIGVVGQNFTDLNKRGYFQALKAGGVDFFISNAEEGLASNKPGVHVARRFVGPNGQFGGVVVINLAVNDVFYPYYQSLRLGSEFATSLRDRTRVLISFPKAKQRDWKEDDLGPISAAIAEGASTGHLLEDEDGDGVEKMTAFEQLEGSNIFATASLPIEQALTEPRRTLVAAIIAALASILAGVSATVAIIRTIALEEARDSAVKANTERSKLIRKLNVVAEEERKIIAAEIHDELNAKLIAVRLDSDRITEIASSHEAQPQCDEIATMAVRISAMTKELYAIGRRIVNRLRPEVIDMLGLKGAVDEMIQSYRKSVPACTFTFTASPDLKGLQTDLAIAAYRVVQEALSNIVKHARATEVQVDIGLIDDGQALHVSITDNGVGIDLGQETNGIGIISMRERVYEFNGEFDIAPTASPGTTVRAKFPIAETAAPPTTTTPTA
ncbi:ATP-binding protein [Ottowia sp.]|uniref:ATP-binding protein n=1 Tax=Ottowia sp. TaxID=1898956 RepID=UPI0025F9529F|nr:ATP-binding protein [Ottowia sp.]MBK6616252.1 hypothetical protein [Ottowia sp.]